MYCHDSLRYTDIFARVTRRLRNRCLVELFGFNNTIHISTAYGCAGTKHVCLAGSRFRNWYLCDVVALCHSRFSGNEEQCVCCWEAWARFTSSCRDVLCIDIASRFCCDTAKVKNRSFIRIRRHIDIILSIWTVFPATDMTDISDNIKCDKF